MKARPVATLVGVAFVILGLGAPAFAASATFTTEVPSGQWKSVRLRNVPAGAVVTVDVELSGALTVTMVSLEDAQRFPAVERPLFSGEADSRLSFSVTAPAAGTYVVLFDNRTGDAARAVEVTLRASRSTPTGATQTILQGFARDLHKIFMFEPFPIRVERCGVPQAFAGRSGIVLCTEYAQKLYDALGDKAKAADALLFTLFHEVAHMLLAQWKYPFFANEEVADEFATAAMIMLGQRARVRAKAEFFAANPSAAEAIAKLFRDDRHPLSPQRARNILRWAEDPQLVRRWQSIFVPHMQTRMLEQLQERPTAWTDLGLVEKELTERR